MKDKYATVYHVHHGDDLYAKKFGNIDDAMKELEQLLYVYQPVWITKTEVIDIYDSLDEFRGVHD